MALRPAQEASIVVCSTCRFSAQRHSDDRGNTGGAVLHGHIVEVAQDRGGDVAVESMACFFACARHCTVHLRAPGKMAYVLGGFTPSRAAAEAIVTFFEHYLASEDGEVAYRLWPDGVKGHFITRTPPPGTLG